MAAAEHLVVARRAGAATVIAGQVAAGLAAHVAVHGCLPGAGALPVVLAVVTAAVATTGHLLRGSSLRVRLSGGQVAVHLSLSAFAACTSAAGHADGAAEHAHAPGGVAVAIPLLMLAAHAGAVLLCIGILEHARRAAETAVTRACCLTARLLLPLRPAAVPTAADRLWTVRPELAPTSTHTRAHGTRGPPALIG